MFGLKAHLESNDLSLISTKLRKLSEFSPCPFKVQASSYSMFLVKGVVLLQCFALEHQSSGQKIPLMRQYEAI